MLNLKFCLAIDTAVNMKKPFFARHFCHFTPNGHLKRQTDCRVLPRDTPCGTPASFFYSTHQSNYKGAIPAPGN